MDATIYVSPKFKTLLEDATIISSDKVPDNEIVVVDSESTLDAALDGKTQISSTKASVVFKANDENARVFFKGKKKEDGADED